MKHQFVFGLIVILYENECEKGQKEHKNEKKQAIVFLPMCVVEYNFYLKWDLSLGKCARALSRH